MGRTLGIVEVRSEAEAGADKRLPSLPMRRIGGKTLLEWVVRRLTDAQQLDDVLVVVPDAKEARQLPNYVPRDVHFFFGSQADSLGRIAAAATRHDGESIVRVRLGQPFVDPVLIDRLVTSARSPAADYVAYCLRGGVSAVHSKLGMFAEWCSAEAIFRADREAVTPDDRDDLTRFLRTHPETFSLRLIPLPTALDRDDFRLAIDVEEDWDHVQVILDALGHDELDWQRIAGLLDQQPDLRAQMARLNRAEACASV